MVVRNPGVQKPHWSAWHSAKACWTGERCDGSLPRPLHGRDVVALGTHGEHQARAHRLPVEEHRARPHAVLTPRACP